jgi:zinc-ribbon domain
MPFCVSCGKENKATAKFCTDCGKAMPQQQFKTAPPDTNPIPIGSSAKPPASFINKIIIGGIGLALAILVFWIANSDNSKPNSNTQSNTETIAQNTPPSSPPAIQPNTPTIADNNAKEDSPPQQPQNNAPIEAIKNIIGQYYALIGNNDCYSINAYYEPVLENYYNRRNLNRSEVLTDCITYQKRWPINSTSVDYNSLQVTNLANGGYLVTYHLSSSLKKTETDDWKTYELFITIHFTDQLKIKSIYEIKQ